MFTRKGLVQPAPRKGLAQTVRRNDLAMSMRLLQRGRPKEHFVVMWLTCRGVPVQPVLRREKGEQGAGVPALVQPTRVLQLPTLPVLVQPVPRKERKGDPVLV